MIKLERIIDNEYVDFANHLMPNGLPWEFYKTWRYLYRSIITFDSLQKHLISRANSRYNKT